MTTYDDLIGRARDKTRLRKTHGLTGWVLAEERLTDELADALQRQQQTIAQLDEWIAVLFDGYAVYGEIQHSTTLTPSDVSRVLDTVVDRKSVV